MLNFLYIVTGTLVFAFAAAFVKDVCKLPIRQRPEPHWFFVMLLITILNLLIGAFLIKWT